MMLQVGVGITGAGKVQWPGHPSRVMLSVSVKEPEAPAVTLTDAPVVDPLIVPLPLIDQLCFTAPSPSEVGGVGEGFVAPQTRVPPVMTEVGAGLTGTLKVRCPGRSS